MCAEVRFQACSLACAVIGPQIQVAILLPPAGFGAQEIDYVWTWCNTDGRNFVGRM